MLVVTVRPMRLADGWWPVTIAVVGSSVGELAPDAVRACIPSLWSLRLLRQ
jgi:hypothetical protein